MDIFLLYIWTRMDAVHGLLIFTLVLLGVCCVVSAMAWFINSGIYEDKAAAGKRAFERFFPWIFLPAILIVAIPSKTDIAIIVAGTATYRAVTSERGSKLASAFADYIEREALSILEKKQPKQPKSE